jgi:sugar phosphate isomerase/epimerase
MEPQNFEKMNLRIKEKFSQFLSQQERIENRIKLSWSNWGFGLEPVETSLERLKKNNVRYVELHGNLYGPDLGYKPRVIKKLLSDYGIEASGICGMFSKEAELASTSPIVRQRAIDYIKRQVEFCSEVGGEYILIVPAAVGRPNRYDDFEFERAVETLQIVGDIFLKYSVKGAIEPIRADEVSICHSFEDAVELIKAINHNGIKHINGDIYHMLHSESHIGETILKYEDYLINLHIADTNRMALGSGMLDLDIILMALYLIGYNNKRAFVSAEPLGPGADPYRQMYGKSDPKMLDSLVSNTVSYFYERENMILIKE